MDASSTTLGHVNISGIGALTLTDIDTVDGAINVTAGGAVTGQVLAIRANALTTGDILYLDNGGDTLTAGSGFFINCNDDEEFKYYM